jgi:short-subunit dehydrogenase
LKQRYGEKTWIVVTGASNDLGRQFSKHFASKGFNVVLIDESGEALAQA